MACNDNAMIIDGSVLEGGGQILRNSISLCAIIKKPIQIIKIRHGRSKPGLSNQHLAGLKLASIIANAKLSGDALGSTEIKFIPTDISHGDFSADAQTAGSISLLAQISLPILAFASNESMVVLKGGTDAQFAPPIDFLRLVAFPYFEKMGLFAQLKTIRRGFYPRGGGIVHMNVKPIVGQLKAIHCVDMGQIVQIKGYAFTSGNVPQKIAYQIQKEAIERFKSSFTCPINIEVFHESPEVSMGNISTFLFIVETSTGCQLAESAIVAPRGPHHSALVDEAVSKLTDAVHRGICCDDFMQDQLILFMALAQGRSTIRVGPLTLHTKTAIYVTEQMLPVKFEITEDDKGVTTISVDGIGHKALV